ncbi:MAG: DUF433 domain-containing protein [Chloroflexi bacterium]|nr:DUF433 domain-containing protein [Chloroflexota bacterium]
MSNYVGIYQMAEASRYLSITAPKTKPGYPTVRRWVRSGVLLNSELDRKEVEVVLSFEDLISLRMIVALRLAGFSLQHIRKVHLWLQNEVTHYPRPFALRDLWVSTTDVFVRMEGAFLSASRQGQFALEFIKDWLRELRRPDTGPLDLTFEKFDGKERAIAWSPHAHIALNPKIQFGSPCISGTRIPTYSVWGMHRAGTPEITIANDYKVPVDAVKAAIDWEQKIDRLAA